MNSEFSDVVFHYSDDSHVDSVDDFVKEDDNTDEECDLQEMAPTSKRRNVAQGKGFSVSLKPEKYPTFLEMHGPTRHVNPNDGSARNYLLIETRLSLSGGTN